MDGLIKDQEASKAQFEEVYPKREREWDTVMGHNDFHHMNTLLANGDYNKIWLIDFEVSSLNFRGYDLAQFIT
jgi:thiamine kinase-like enzyme